MKNTNIEWTDHTINFWWGCTKVSPACANCYAESVAKVFGKRIFGAVPQWGAGKPRAERLERARIEALALNRQAAKKGIRYRVFVNSMSDWLDGEVPIEWLSYLLETLSMCPNLDFQLLTKRPKNWHDRIKGCFMRLEFQHGRGDTPLGLWLHQWFHDKTPPPNIWIGTTVESQAWADKRIPPLLGIPAKVRFLSCEPLLGQVDLPTHSLFGPLKPQENATHTEPRIHWVIVGGESGAKTRPMYPEWASSLRDQCSAASVPFFFKQWGEWCPATKEFGVNVRVMPENGILRGGKPVSWVGFDGRMEWPGSYGLTDPIAMARMGSKNTGCLLDSRKHSEFPNGSMYNLVTYKDFQGRIQSRSFALSPSASTTRVRMRADCSTILQVQPITKQDHEQHVGKQLNVRRLVHNRKAAQAD